MGIEDYGEEEVKRVPKANLLVITLIFVAAKLFGWFPFGWFFVFIPLWFPIAVAIIFIVSFFLLYLISLLL